MNHQHTRRGFTQIITEGNNLFTSPLEGEDVRRTKEGVWNKLGCITPLPAFGHPLPQGARMITRGFTLIELLVVVLIIGILAAVALPQYQLAVVKSRVAAMLPIIKSIADAEEVYYLANGEYTNNLTLLDINPPAECSSLNTDGQHWKCGNDFLLFATGALTVYADYCPGYNGVDWETCSTKREFQLQKYFKHISYTENGEPKNDKWGCIVKNKSQLGKKVCDTFVPQN